MPCMYFGHNSFLTRYPQKFHRELILITKIMTTVTVEERFARDRIMPGINYRKLRTTALWIHVQNLFSLIPFDFTFRYHAIKEFEVNTILGLRITFLDLRCYKLFASLNCKYDLKKTQKCLHCSHQP